ncbi:MAG: ATP-binding cassette domain-containing protein [Gallicola sp.]|uniref:ATP-binding cassette domain-containing protein n=1 Tax=Gallicola sp. Sow4_E12 TaxID=3438785 RepID=UPI001821D299|nr:ATP-binding cassette domain-containing protein [Gallicola sp.]
MISFKIKKQLDHFLLEAEYAFGSGVLVLDGKSGAGKTTILNCISGLVDPDEGEVRIHDHKVFDSKDYTNVPTRDRNIGYVFQGYALFPHLNIYENIIYGLKARKKNIDKEKVHETMRLLGIEHLSDKRTKAISGGEKQRAALARVLVTEPDILLLDEPFSALDIETKESIYPIFDRIKENYNLPMILVSHNPLERDRFADHWIHIEEGKVRG